MKPLEIMTILFIVTAVCIVYAVRTCYCPDVISDELDTQE
jgi:hypothetical protein